MTEQHEPIHGDLAHPGLPAIWPNVLEWPSWVPFVTAIVPVVVALDVLRQREGLWPPGVTAVVMLVTISPWLIDVVSELVTRGWRRPVRFGLPAWLFSVVVISGSAFLLFQNGHDGFVDLTPFFLVILTAEMGARLRPVPTLFVAAASMVVLITSDIFGPHDHVFVWVIGVGFAWIGGGLIGYSARLAVSLKRAESDLASKAAAGERSRIAREVHDVIAHSLSVTMLHVTAARMALEKGAERSEEALESLREAERQGRKSLADIRRTVGLLGPDDAGTSPPLPTALDIARLVGDFRRAGMDVTLRLDGDIASLPATAGLSLYRIVQESLTNVVKYAPGAATSVALVVTDTDLRLRVHNGPPDGSAPPARSNGGGLGIKGMVERAHLLGGTLAASPVADGWVVSLDAPRPTTDAPAPAERA